MCMHTTVIVIIRRIIVAIHPATIARSHLVKQTQCVRPYAEVTLNACGHVNKAQEQALLVMYKY